MDNLADRVAIVSGGASGIGLAAAHRFAHEGAKIVIADVQREAGQIAAETVEGLFVETDVSDSASWDMLVTEAIDTFGRLDIAFLNAGVTTGEPDIRHLTNEQYRRIMAVNIDGVVFGARAVASAMTSFRGGAIVATASLAGLIGFPPDPIYSLTKHAVIGLVRSLGPQLAPHGVTVNAVCPGVVDTPLVGDEAKARLRDAGFPLIAPETIADAVVAVILSGETGQAWVCQPGRKHERFEFRQVPGPRAAGAEGMRPPTEMSGQP